jgi:hypothetical protein
MPLDTRGIGGMVDVVAVGLVVTAGYQHKEHGGNRNNESRAKCKSTKQ